MIFRVRGEHIFLGLYTIFKMKKYRYIFIYFVLLPLIFISGCEQLTEDFNRPEYNNPLKIGVVGDVSVLREQVENMFFGAQLAGEEINNVGGIEINGESFEVVGFL